MRHEVISVPTARELTVTEIDAVEGGLLPLLAGIAVGALLVGGAYLIAEANDGNGEQTKK